MDKILIRNIHVFAYHGVLPEEKQNGQPFLVDLALSVDLSRAGQSDCLDDTVCYASVTDLTVQVMTAQSYNLIEHAAERVASAVLAAFPAVSAITVTIQKPEAPMPAPVSSVAVEITRQRESTV